MRVPTPKEGAKTYYVVKFFAENCMKMKEIGPREGACVPNAPPDLPMYWDPLLKNRGMSLKKEFSFSILNEWFLFQRYSK